MQMMNSPIIEFDVHGMRMDPLFRRSGTAERNIDCHSTRSCSGLTGASGRLPATTEGLPDQVG